MQAEIDIELLTYQLHTENLIISSSSSSSSSSCCCCCCCSSSSSSSSSSSCCCCCCCRCCCCHCCCCCLSGKEAIVCYKSQKLLITKYCTELSCPVTVALYPNTTKWTELSTVVMLPC